MPDNNTSIIEGNRLIAEFMGYKFEEKTLEKELVRYTITKPGENDWYYGSWEKQPLEQYMTEGFRYHSSWDWLMPVAKKIRNDYYIEINFYGDNTRCQILKERGGDKICVGKHLENGSSIIVVYTAVVQFIKWFNTQTSNNG